DSTLPRISTRRRISSVCCANEVFLDGGYATNAYVARGENGVARFDRIRTRDPDQCKNDRDGTVDHDERLRITGVEPGRYDVKLSDKTGRVCIVRSVEVKEGAVFAIVMAAETTPAAGKGPAGPIRAAMNSSAHR